jgi:hypothetical protein
MNVLLHAYTWRWCVYKSLRSNGYTRHSTVVWVPKQCKSLVRTYPVRTLAVTPNILSEDHCKIPVLPSKWIIIQVRATSLPSISFPIHLSSVISALNAVQSEVAAVPLNTTNKQIREACVSVEVIRTFWKVAWSTSLFIHSYIFAEYSDKLRLQFWYELTVTLTWDRENSVTANENAGYNGMVSIKGKKVKLSL